MFFYFSPKVIKKLKSLNKNDSLLLINIEGRIAPFILKTLAKHLPSQMKKSIWFSNPVCKMSLFYKSSIVEIINEIKKSGYTIYTFDQNDAFQFDLVYLNQVYRYPDFDQENNIEYDFYFCGTSKDRNDEISKIKKYLDERNFKTNFIVIDEPKSYISYEENIQNIVKSRCIVDLVQQGQSGISLRPLEQIFFRKKLLTDSHDISNIDFYHKNNIFRIGVDNIDEIKSFMNTPHKIIENKILSRYDVNHWLNNFL
jgi:hypothetical protein